MFLQEVNTEHSVKCSSSTIFQQILTFLKANIYINTEIICWIINKLISIVPNIHDIASNLQDIYFSTLKSCLKHIPARKSLFLNYTASDSSEADSATHGNSLQMVLCLLSKVNIDTDAEVEFLKLVYPMLSKSHHIKDIELALYSRKNEKLLSEWLSFWNETYACLENATILSTAYKIGESIFKLTENSEMLLCKQQLVKRTSIRKLHWLNDILVSIIF